MFCVFLWIFENNCPGVGFKHAFSALGVRVSHFLCLGDSSFQETLLEICPGGWSGLKLTDTLVYLNAHVHTPEQLLY